MKFHPTWQQVTLLAVLFAAVITSHVWAPGSAAAIVSLVSVLIGYLAPHKPKEEQPTEGGE